jgi:3-hydroxy-9,10-secoandrosta-1,3,5(10)-triene-9,17-dione monooxygenase reductase component
VSAAELSACAPAQTPQVARSATQTIDVAAFRRVLGRFATGVTLVTAADESGPLGLVVNACASVSLEPPLIAICPSRSSFTWSRMRHSGRFGVNVLATESAAYARGAAHPETDRFAGVEHELSASGVPRLRDAIAFLDCEPVSEHVAGDHWVVIARVHELLADWDRSPLVFADGRLGTFTTMEGYAP